MSALDCPQIAQLVFAGERARRPIGIVIEAPPQMFSLMPLLVIVAVMLMSVGVAVVTRRPGARRKHDDARGRAVRPLKLMHAINDDRGVGCDACVVVFPTEVLELVSNKSRVVRLLRDPEQHRGQMVLGGGGGDSAVEAAVALGATARAVTRSYRGKALARCKAKNRQALDRAVAEGKVRVIYQSQVVEIQPVGDEQQARTNDHVFVCIDGEPPTKWLIGLGVQLIEQPHLFARPASDARVESLVGPQRETRGVVASANRLARTAAALLVLALGAALSGCLTDLVPLTTNGSSPDAAPSINSTPPPCSDAGMSGFTCGVWPSVKMLGCPGCHNGGPPMKLVAAPASASDWKSNYTEFSARAKSGAMSLVLTKNLTGSGITHAGGSPFASTSDPTYTAWLAWINAGAPE
jgi:hypothetical protein